MAFKIIQVFLTEHQIRQIRLGVGPNGDDDQYALLAEPKLNGEVLNVQVVTKEQYDILLQLNKRTSFPHGKPRRTATRNERPFCWNY